MLNLQSLGNDKENTSFWGDFFLFVKPTVFFWAVNIKSLSIKASTGKTMKS